MQTKQIYHNYYNAKQLKLPLEMDIKIPFDSEVRTFDEVFTKSGVKKYLVSKEIGRKGHNLVSMLKLVLFCNMINIYTLRAMEKAAQNDIRIMWLTNELKPSHQAIGNFINNHISKSINEIFVEINKYLIKADDIDTSIIYVDGTKIESAANKYTFVWKGAVEKNEVNLHKKITKTINKLNTDYKAMGVTFNEYEVYDENYLVSIKAYLEKEIEHQKIVFVHGSGKRKTSLQRNYEQIVDYTNKLREYLKHYQIMGNDRKSYSKTDHDATFMRLKEDYMRNDQLKPAYNLQIGVSNEYIINLIVSQERTDFNTFIPFLKNYYNKYGFYPKYPVADAGYGSFNNYKFLKANGMELYQKYTMYEKDRKDKKYLNDEYRPHNLIKIKDKHFKTKSGEDLKYLYTSKYDKDYYYSEKQDRNIMIHEENLNFQKEAIRNLNSDLGIELRVQRSIQVEGAFGVIKENYGFRRFKRRGLNNVELEVTLLAIGYNLLKYHNRRFKIIQ